MSVEVIHPQSIDFLAEEIKSESSFPASENANESQAIKGKKRSVAIKVEKNAEVTANRFSLDDREQGRG